MPAFARLPSAVGLRAAPADLEETEPNPYDARRCWDEPRVSPIE
jgi:hypothetical protein